MSAAQPSQPLADSDVAVPRQLPFSGRLGMSLLLGALSTLANGPIHAWCLAPACIAGWVLAIEPGRPLQNFVVGLVFGVGWFTAGLWWIGAGLFKFTAAGAGGAVVITALLVLSLSSSPAIAAILIGKLRRGISWPARWFVVAACWTTTAWLLRNTLFSGLPWLSVGTSQLAGPLSHWAPVGGSLLVEFLALIVAAALADAISACTPAHWNPRQATGAALSICLVLAASIFMKTLGWTQSVGELRVRLAQGNLPQQEKFSVEGLQRAGRVYGEAIANSDAELTILPETAFPMTWESLPAELRRNLRQFASANQTAVMLGALIQEPSGSLTNNLLLIAPSAPLAAAPGDSDIAYDGRYTKQHLVFLGEYLPASLLWLGKQLNIAYSNLTPGVDSNDVLDVGAARIASTICFESQFGAVNARHARDANLLVNISNFAWFIGTWAAAEDLDVIRMRSLETGRWTARAANSGVTALIDDTGTIIEALPQDVTAMLDGSVELRAGLTPYDRTGDLSVAIICGMSFLIWIATAAKRSLAARR